MASWLPQESQRVVNNVWEIAVQKTGGYVASRLILAVLSRRLHVGLPAHHRCSLLAAAGHLDRRGLAVHPDARHLPRRRASGPVRFFGKAFWTAILVIVFVIVYQQVENYFFSPRISNRTMNIHPAVAFGAVIVGAALGGALGALIAIPIVASIQSSLRPTVGATSSSRRLAPRRRTSTGGVDAEIPAKRPSTARLPLDPVDR